MRNLHLEKTLELLGHDSADQLNSLIEAGEEVAYEVIGPGDGSPLCQYEPLSAQFVRDHGGDMQHLGSFARASEAMSQTDLAAPYLQEMGIDVPAHPERRSDLAVLAFLCRLWDGSAEFTFDDAKFNSAYGELEACGEPAEGEAEVVVPLYGLQMDMARVDVGGVAIVAADSVDVPAEARRGEGSGRAAWEPVFLATSKIDLAEARRVEVEGGSDPVAETFNRLITTLRLFKEGSVGIGPHAWVAVGDERWRRVATGAARPRAGQYRLTDEEVVDLADFARSIARRPSRIEALERAINRFEAGLERRSVLDSLNDHLLSLRFLLDGEGAAGFGFAMRVAALAVEAEDRAAAKASIEGSLALERQLWSGEPATDTSIAPAQLAQDIEDMARGIIKRCVSGALPTDLRAAADEILLGSGAATPAPDGPGEGTSTDRAHDPISDAAHALEGDRSASGATAQADPAAIAAQSTQEFTPDFSVPPAGLNALLAGAGAGAGPTDTNGDMPSPTVEETGQVEVRDEAPVGEHDHDLELNLDLNLDISLPAPAEAELPHGEADEPQVTVEPAMTDEQEMSKAAPAEADPGETCAMDAIDSDQLELETAGPIEVEGPLQVQISSTPAPHGDSGREREDTYDHFEASEDDPIQEEPDMNPPAWLDEVGAPKTSEWPVGSRKLRDELESSEPQKDMSKRVSFLFPRPETTEWSVGDPQGRIDVSRSA